MNLATELEASLKEFLAAGLVDLHENGGRVSFGDGLSWEVRGDGEKPRLPLWAERFNVTRRVLAITDQSEHRLVLAVERFGRSRPDRLEFVRREFDNCLTFGLLWLSRVRNSHAGGTIAGLRVILPKDAARTVAHRLGSLDSRLALDLYEHEPMLNVLEKIDSRSAGNVDTWLVPAREPESNPFCSVPGRRWTPLLLWSRAPSLCTQRCKRGKCGCGLEDYHWRAGRTGEFSSELANAAGNLQQVHRQT